MLNSHDGFTMVEVIVALLVLTVGLLGLAATAGRLHTAVARSGSEAVAQQAADDRLARVLLHPRYGELDSLFTAVEDPIDDLDDYRRVTDVSRVIAPTAGGGQVDFTRVTVTVEGPMIEDPVVRTAVVGAP